MQQIAPRKKKKGIIRSATVFIGAEKELLDSGYNNNRIIPKSWKSLEFIIPNRQKLGTSSDEMKPHQDEPTRVTRALQRIQTGMAITFMTDSCKKRCRYHSACSKDDFDANCKAGYCCKPAMLHG
jgi:hypothetical protein